MELGMESPAMTAALVVGSVGALYALVRRRPAAVAHHEKLPRLQSFVGAVGGRMKVGFDAVLGVSALEVNEWCADKGLIYNYTVPERLCRDGVLPLSVAMSLLDTASSYAIVGEDRTHRPGVSVKLSAHYTSKGRLIRAGDTVQVCSKVSKVGGTMGFAQCSIKDAASGAVLIRGEHVKYLPMGAAWDLLFSGYLTPVVRLVAGWGAARLPVSVAAAQQAPLHDILQLDGVERTAAGHVARFRAASGVHSNPIGGVHGGCQAVLCEQLAAAAKPDAAVQGMSVTYVSGGKGELALSAHPSTHAVHVEIAKQRVGGAVVATAEVYFFE